MTNKYNLNELYNNIYLKLKNKIKNNNEFLISFSGGIDSTLLLEIMIQIKINIDNNLLFKAIHINHNFNIKSLNWMNYCIEYCKNRNIYIYTKNINLKTNSNIESNLRTLRFKEISKIFNKNNILLTAHNKNDKIETFFLRLIRSGGLKSLQSINEKRNLYNIKIISPLLNYSKDDIYKYSKLLKLKHIYDYSNRNLSFDRNFIRHKIISVFEIKWNNFLNLISKSIYINKINYNLLNFFIKKDIKKYLNINNILNINLLIKYKYKYYYIFSIIIKWLNINNINHSYNLINSIYENILFNERYLLINKIFLLKNKYIIKYNNFLYCIKKIKLNNKDIFVDINKIKFIKNNCIKFNYGFIKIAFNIYEFLCLYKNIKNFIKIRIPNKYERFYLKFNYLKIKDIKFKICGFNNIKVLDIFNTFKIPHFIRNYIPHIYYDNILISSLGIFNTENSINNKCIYIFYKYNLYFNK